MQIQLLMNISGYGFVIAEREYSQIQTTIKSVVDDSFCGL